MICLLRIELEDPHPQKELKDSSPTKRYESAKRTNPFLVKDSESLYGSALELPVRIRTPVPIRTPRSRVNVRCFAWEGEGDMERILILQEEGVLSVRSPCFVAADSLLFAGREC
ncbi:hypothetical protein AVEN_204514-1 [Araneus ventricosus]|uniref:Uncharacterized protein n=1 Tax=Araneus ventricosus TaxID=182803 RepID=A0A4Y2QYD4_ARAVE|nr:hypothetical protein AVEN_204514-1 [Araneus ventricosus]